jgi:multidrug efflux pump
MGLAIIVMLGGVGAILALPIAQYPDVAPPQVSINASYPARPPRRSRTRSRR